MGEKTPEEAAYDKPIVEKAQKRGRLGSLRPIWSALINVVGAAAALFFLVTTFVRVPLYGLIAVYMAVTLLLIFIIYPASKHAKQHRPTVVDACWIAAALVPAGYYVVNFGDIIARVGLTSTPQMVLGTVMSLACFEACRRVLGWSLVVVSSLAMAYALFGANLPGMFGHSGFSFSRLLTHIYSQEGIFGIVARTYALFVVLFVILGVFMQESGAGRAFINLALALVGKRPGGAAKTAVLSSGVAGSVIGAGAANITITGTFTIPLMKRVGIPPHVAAAIETVASVGGHLVPPVMGAAAFVMATFTGIPYIKIALVSILPAILLYISFLAQVHFYCVKRGIGSVAEADSAIEVPRVSETMKRDGILLAPLLMLVVVLVLGYSPFRAAVITLIAAWFSVQGRAIIQGERLMSLGQALRILGNGIVSSLSIGATAGVIGILLAAVALPGTGLVLASWVVSLSGGSLLLAFILIVLISYIMGMGLTITAAYIIVAVVAAPALVELGVPLITAHLVIIWLSQDSAYSPPFALGSYIAAGIADAHPMKTAWRSLLMGKPMYIIPLLMIYTDILPVDGLTFGLVLTFTTSALGLVAFAGVTEGYWFHPLGLPQRMVLLVSALLLLSRWHSAGLVGVAILLTLAAIGRKAAPQNQVAR